MSSPDYFAPDLPEPDGPLIEAFLDDPDEGRFTDGWQASDISPTFPEAGSVNPRAPALHKAPGEAGVWITRRNYSWSAAPGQPAAITYAFRSSAPSYTVPGSNVGGTFSTFNPTQIAAAQSAIDLWSDIARITFTRIGTGFSNAASILFGDYRDGGDGAAAFAYYPSAAATASSSAAGDLWDNQYYGYNVTPAIGNYGWLTLLHELGHTIGLEHPGDYNAAPGVSITYENNAVYFEDSRQYSVMSYFSATNTGASHGSAYAATPLLDDITALQRLYGANPNTRTGNTTYGFNSNADRAAFQLTSSSEQRVFAIYDAGGTDTLDLSGYSQHQVISLEPGTFSSAGGLTGNISIATNTIIENAIGGSGPDTFYGNGVDNVIDGRGGTDTVVYTGLRSEYLVRREGSVLVLLDSRPARDATDRLSNIEVIQFADQSVATDVIDAPTFVITATDARRPEGNAGSTALTFTITRSIELTRPIDIAWFVSGGGTASPDDFAGNAYPAGAVTFAPGVTSRSFTVQAAGDTRREADDTFNVTIGGPSGIYVPTATAAGAILDDDTQAVVGWVDATSNTSGAQILQAAAAGGPGYLVWQYIYAGTDGLSVATSAPNTFIHTGSGDDAIQSGDGTNVIDGGTGSNFLTGGTGADTFFTDARTPAVVWNTIRNFGAGDAATLWGYTEGISSWHWDPAISGAQGAQGATLRANIIGGGGRAGDGIDASITFAGLSVEQAQRLQVATGTQSAGSLLYLYNPGV